MKIKNELTETVLIGGYRLPSTVLEDDPEIQRFKHENISAFFSQSSFYQSIFQEMKKHNYNYKLVPRNVWLTPEEIDQFHLPHDEGKWLAKMIYMKCTPTSLLFYRMSDGPILGAVRGYDHV